MKRSISRRRIASFIANLLLIQYLVDSAQGQNEGFNGRVVNLVVTKAPLLGGGVRECAQEDCFEGGVAAVQALVRYYSALGNTDQTLVIPEADFKSPLTFMSQFLIGVNLMIFRNVLGWRSWTLPSYTIIANRFEQRTVEDAQQATFPALMSNVILAADFQSFFGYVEPIHWDKETNLAVIYVGKDEKPDFEADAAATAMALTRYIYKRNAMFGCPNTPIDPPPLAAFSETPFDVWYQQEGDIAELPSIRDAPNPDECFHPVVVFDFKGKVFERAEIFWETMMTNTDESSQPALLLDVRGTFLPDNTLSRVEKHSERMWVAHHATPETDFFQVQIQTSLHGGISNVTIFQENLLNLPAEAKTEAYYEDSNRIRQYARQAYETSLMNELGAITDAMPAAVAEDGYHFCNVQECEIGNLAADALRWKQGTDIAILPSFFFQGPGWASGEVRYLELNENLQFVGQRCAGVMTGLSIHRALEYSLNTTTFDGYYEIQDPLLNKEGLFQVSGMTYTYNYKLEGEKVLEIKVWDDESKVYQPLERTRLYSFVSGSHLCFTFKGFPPYFTDLLTADGEVPAERVTDLNYVDDIKDYLLEFHANERYTPRLEGRLRFDPNKTNAMPLIDKDDCIGGTEYWSNSRLMCKTCPTFNRVRFSNSMNELRGVAYSTEALKGEIILENHESFAISVHPEMLSVPSYITLDFAVNANKTDGNYTFVIPAGQALKTGLTFDATERESGTDTSSLLFQITPAEPLEGCPSYKLRQSVVVYLTLPSDKNYLEGVVAFGFISAGMIIIASACFAVWVWYFRNLPVVCSMQPPFLLTLLLGIVLISLAIVPLSIDDRVASQEACNVACMTQPWFLSVGLIVSMSALFTKLLRINRLFNGERFRRQQVREKDVLLPLVTVVLLNILLLSIWTGVDPLKWERHSVEGERWKTYGKCSLSEGGVGEKMMTSIIVLCVCSFLGLAWQAFKARNISTNYSESTYLGMAVFSWMQLSVVCIPVLFLVEDSNVVARYGLAVGLLFAICMSILLFIFLPIVYMSRQKTSSKTNIHVSGLNLSSSLQLAYKESNRNENRSHNGGSLSIHLDQEESSLQTRQVPGLLETSRSLTTSKVRNLSSGAESHEPITEQGVDLETGEESSDSLVYPDNA